MGKINYGRVILGGIVAGIVATILDGFSQGVVLSKLMKAFAQSVNKPTDVSGTAILGMILLEIVFGIAAVWAYAAIRPRFGAGVRTATYAGLLTWIFQSLPGIAQTLGGLMPLSLTFGFTALGLVSSVVATIAGAALYKEAASTAAYPAAAAPATR
jgi:hypothetical protein